MNDWGGSVFCYDHNFTEKFDDFFALVYAKLNHLEEQDEWDYDDKKKYDLLLKIADIHNECIATSISDI